MIKIAMIGAGSVGFTRNLTGDILAYPEFKNATFSYMDISDERLEVAAALGHKVAAALAATPRIETTTDLRAALDGADFVINTMQIGGFDATLMDFEIPRKYGLNFTIADTTGPGGLFRALRTFGPIRDLCAQMEEVCPRAILLNYSNPMSMNMQTIARTSNVRAVGLCHSVQGTIGPLERYLGEDAGSVNFVVAGINHMAFFLKLEKNGEDLYPRLFERMNDPKVYHSNRVRFELMKRLGYFVTESSEHNAEYNPFFIPHGAQTIEEFGVPIDEYLRRSDSTVDEFGRLQKIARSDEPLRVQRSHEYGSVIIHSVATNTPAVVYGNMPNHGAIPNLPATAIVEVPTLCDGNGLQFTRIGELPPQLVGYVQPHITQHELFIRAAMEGRRDHVYQACLFDPLTAATARPDKIVEMCDEMIEAYGELLPDLDAKKTLVPASGKTFESPTRAQLRASWDAAQKKATADLLLDWKIIGPFECASSALETDYRNGNLAVTYASESGEVSWQHLPRMTVRVAKEKAGLIDLLPLLGNHAGAVAYAVTELEEVHAREAVTRLCCDGDFQLWLNGELLKSGEEVVLSLRAGVNRLLLRAVCGQSWSFSAALPTANY